MKLQSRHENVFSFFKSIYFNGDIMISKKINILIIFLLTISIFGYFKIKASELPLYEKIIYLDPGHGGIDPGSTYKDIYEKDINLSICFKLKQELEKQGANVYLTRYGDYDLSTPNTKTRKKSDLNNRVRMINDSNANIYISIHLNSYQSNYWHGAQVFYDDVNKENKEIATIIQKELKENLNTDREIGEIKTMLLNRKVTIPGILIEVGFLSNDNERYLLKQEKYQEKVSKVITNGLIKYFNN